MRRFCILTLIAVLLPLTLSAQPAQTLQSTYFQSFAAPENEVPEVSPGGDFAFADYEIAVHALRDNDTAQLVKAWVNFNIEYFLDLPQDLIAMHIHRGRSFEAGPVVIGSGMDPISDTRVGVITAQAEVSDPTELAAVDAILGDPQAFYLNIHSAEFPGGLLRSQLRTKQVGRTNQVFNLTLFHHFTSFFEHETAGAAHATATDKIDILVDRQRRILGALGILTREEAAE